MRNPKRPRLEKLLLATAIFVAVAACTEATSSPEQASRPLLWRIEGEVPQFLFGTFHVPDPRVTDLPPAVEAALGAADVVVTELRMNELSGAEAAMALPAGQSLADLVAPATYRRLSAYLASRGVPLQYVERQKVWGAMRLLLVLEMTELAAAGSPALDQVIWNHARERGGKTDGLETLKEQLDTFDSFSVADQEAMLVGTLDLLEDDSRNYLQETIVIYLKGDEDELARFAMENTGIENNPRLQQEYIKRVITDRNTRMVERIVSRLRSRPDAAHFFAVGALHYTGAQGIVAQLRARGYRVTRVEPSLGGGR